ncbi:LURP-one-related/scramblase family protein [Actinocorallia populi]|uniref:LURP-one-related/scramblase family protein n=1 Tax=Actinocorallia populi TaxID=2079200 RepID=UPI000D0961DF|nr:LURP-one-related family protein [Actinocorallia populi]
MRYRVQDRVFSIGDDSWIEDEQGRRAFLLDGRTLRVRRTYELKDGTGEVLLVIRKKIIALRETMVVERDGAAVARIHRKVKLVRDRFRVDLEDGGEWTVTGDFLDKEYEIDRDSDGARVARVSRRWLRLRDTYTVDVSDGFDVPLVLAAAVAVDALAGPDSGS